MLKSAIIACSDPMSENNKIALSCLQNYLTASGCDAAFVGEMFFYKGEDVFERGKRNASVLMSVFKDPEINYIFDISGGDLSNTVLPYLDFEAIRTSHAVFFGYSDLTVLLNAIYTITQKSSVLYQIRNIEGSFSVLQRERLKKFLHSGVDLADNSYTNNNPFPKERTELTDIKGSFINGSSMEGILVGGNIRCLLKLAGTPYFPDMTNKLLLLEAMSGSTNRIASYFMQLKQLGVFEQVSGIVLGTFTESDRTNQHSAAELLLGITEHRLPVFHTPEIGHAPDSKAAVIGKLYQF